LDGGPEPYLLGPHIVPADRQQQNLVVAGFVRVTVRVAPVSPLVTVTVVPGMPAPEGSSTRPVTEAVTWAKPMPATNVSAANNASERNLVESIVDHHP
jgi:hypothetical protein